MTSPILFLQEVRIELNKVDWPSREQVTRLTLVVVSVSVLVALYISGLDYVFTKLMELFLNLK